MLKKLFDFIFVIFFVATVFESGASADSLSVTSGVDFYNRYVWRGLDIANTPSIQPAFSLGLGGAELGVWGAYTLSDEDSATDEIDFWLSYSFETRSGIGITAIITDYYFPSAGIKFFNFNSHDATKDDTIPDPGAHTLELGLSVTGSASFPAVLSGYVNVHNDGGNCTYFQVDYPVKLNETDLNFFVGGTGGSKENPGYYGAENLQLINVGVTVSREQEVTDSFSLPLSVSLVVNPHAEISYLLVGISL